MRGLFVTFLIVLACVTAYGVMPRNGGMPATVLEADEDATKETLKAGRIPLASVHFTNVVSQVVRSNAGALGDDSLQLLEHAICQWGRALNTGTFGDFLAFRQPDYFIFTGPMESAISNKQVAAGLPIPRTERDKANAHFEMLNRISFEAIAHDSLRLVLQEYATVKDATNSNIRIRYILKHWAPSTGSLHAGSPLRHKVTVCDAVEANGRVQCALVSGRFISKGGKYTLPLQVVWFWSAQERKWKPYESFMNSLMPIEPDRLSPSLYF